MSEIFGAIAEALFVWCLELAPKPVRYGCTAILLTLVAALLILALWSAVS
jgi:hypothetical protein